MLPKRRALYGVLLSTIPEPLYVRLGSTDWLVLEEIFIHGEYDSAVESAKELGPVLHIVDLGANVGMSIRLWQSRFPAAKIIAVEPDAENLQVCRANIAAGPSPSSVSLVAACITPQDCIVGLIKPADEEWAIRISESAEATVRGIPVDMLLAEQNLNQEIDLLKCDIEGAESEVFKACSKWIRQVGHLVVEVHGDYKRSHLLADIAANGGDFTVLSVSEYGDYSVIVLRNSMRLLSRNTSETTRRNRLV